MLENFRANVLKENGRNIVANGNAKSGQDGCDILWSEVVLPVPVVKRMMNFILKNAKGKSVYFENRRLLGSLYLNNNK